MTINPYLTSTWSEDIFRAVISKLGMKDRSVLATTCSYFQMLLTKTSPLKTISSFLGHPKEKWISGERFQQIQRTSKTSLKLNFDCKNIVKINRYIKFYHGILLKHMSQGFYGIFQINGCGIPKKEATPYNWGIRFEFCTNIYASTQVEMVGTVKKTITEPKNHRCENYGYANSQFTCSLNSNHAPKKIIDSLIKLRTYISDEN